MAILKLLASIKGTLGLKKDDTDNVRIKLNEVIDTVNSIETGSQSFAEHITATTNSTSTSTGALILDGGAGIVKDVFIGGALNVAGAFISSATTDSTTSTTGALTTAGGLGIAKALFVGTNLSVVGATDSTTSTTGSLVTAGGLGVAKAIFGGSTITAATTLNAGTLVLTGAGAVGAPSHSFTGTPTQGMYSVSATQVGISNGAAGLNLVVDTTGISTNSIKAQTAIGTTPVGTVSIVEYSTGKDVTTVLTLTNFIVGALAGAAAALGVGNIVYAFPAGQHFELVDSLSSIVLTAVGTAVATDTGLGSVIATGAVAVLDGTTTFEDRLTGITINTAAGGGAAASSIATTTAGVGSGIGLNAAGSVKNVFLNSAGTWNANNVGSLTASGTIVLKWTRM
jgi:hypothetical protein